MEGQYATWSAARPARKPPAIQPRNPLPPCRKPVLSTDPKPPKDDTYEFHTSLAQSSDIPWEPFEEFFTPVRVRRAVSPTEFYVSLENKEVVRQNLIKSMTLWYDSHIRSELLGPPLTLNDISVGSFYAGQFLDSASGNRTWYRIYIMGKLLDGKVRVLLVDIGNESEILPHSMRRLRKLFCETPSTILQAKLCVDEEYPIIWNAKDRLDFQISAEGAYFMAAKLHGPEDSVKYKPYKCYSLILFNTLSCGKAICGVFRGAGNLDLIYKKTKRTIAQSIAASLSLQ